MASPPWGIRPLQGAPQAMLCPPTSVSSPPGASSLWSDASRQISHPWSGQSDRELRAAGGHPPGHVRSLTVNIPGRISMVTGVQSLIADLNTSPLLYP